MTRVHSGTRLHTRVRCSHRCRQGVHDGVAQAGAPHQAAILKGASLSLKKEQVVVGGDMYRSR